MTAPDLFARFAGHVSPGLLSSEGWEAITRLGRALPRALTDTFLGLELRLGEGAGFADLSLKTRSAAAATLALAAGTGGATDWDTLRALAAAWSDARSTLHRHVVTAWLEYDVSAGGPPSAPSVLLRTEIWARPGREAELWRAEEGRFFAETFQLLSGRAAPDWLEAGIADVLRRMPSGTRVAYMAVMRRPGVEGVRLIINVQGAAALRELIVAVGLGAQAAAMDDWFLLLPTIGRSLHAQIDVGRAAPTSPGDAAFAISPTFAIECFNDHADRSEQRLLDALVTRGLCLPERRDALLAAVGATLRGADTPALECEARYLTHVKLAFSASGVALAAKAYLGCEVLPGDNPFHVSS